jgi:hypothetical protein
LDRHDGGFSKRSKRAWKRIGQQTTTRTETTTTTTTTTTTAEAATATKND